MHIFGRKKLIVYFFSHIYNKLGIQHKQAG